MVILRLRTLVIIELGHWRSNTGSTPAPDQNGMKHVAFNTAERWAKDVSEYVAREITRGGHRDAGSNAGVVVKARRGPQGRDAALRGGGIKALRIKICMFGNRTHFTGNDLLRIRPMTAARRSSSVTP